VTPSAVHENQGQPRDLAFMRNMDPQPASKELTDDQASGLGAVGGEWRRKYGTRARGVNRNRGKTEVYLEAWAAA